MTPDVPGNAKERPPYQIILDELRAGRAIPFLGAGASRLEVLAGDAAGAPLPQMLPSGWELAQTLALDSDFPEADEDRDDLAKVASYYVDVSNRDALRSRLRKVFAKADYLPNRLHHFLAKMANGENLKDGAVFVTTNYDTLLEKAFRDAGKKFDLVVYPADNRNYANALLWWQDGKSEPETMKPSDVDVAGFRQKNVIYKMHGSVHPDVDSWDGFVITEEDYISFLSRMKNAVPGAFRTYFKNRPFLFLGYGLRDWNLRVLLKEVSNRDIVSWAIKYDPSLFEKRVWKRRGVNVFDQELGEFVTEMEARHR